MYDDGERETRVEERLIKKKDGGGGKDSFREGDKIEADYRGRGKFYPGKISRDRGDDTYDIDYDDGERETRVSKRLIRSKDGGGSSTKLEEGDKVRGCKVEASREKYYPGKITRDRGDGTYDISYDDGERETRVEERLIRKKDRDRSRSARAAATTVSARATRSKPIIGAAANSTRARSLEIEATIRTTSPTTTASASCASPRG